MWCIIHHMKPPAQLPNSVEELQKMVVALSAQNIGLTGDIQKLQGNVHKLEGNVHKLENQIRQLEELNQLLLHKRFGANSEKYRSEQSDLFNEAEVYAPEQNDEDLLATGEEETVETTAPSAQKSVRQSGRKPLPPLLPRIEVIHDLPETERFCPEGHPLKEMGNEISEQLDIIPAKVQVLRHIRKKYACSCCQGHVSIAKLPAQPIPKSNASPGLLAYIATSKFLDALPLYRQSKQFARGGIHLPRATMASWMIKTGQLVMPLHQLMTEAALSQSYLQMDETTLQVLKEEGKAASTQSYVWVRRGGSVDQPVVLFDYAPTRSQKIAESLLYGFTGTLQSDGYQAYSGLCSKNHLLHAGCWAHARRKFDEALKAQGSKSKSGKASKALLMIQKLYRVEILIKDLQPDDKRLARQEKAVPILNEMKRWLDQSIHQVTPSSLTGKALAYLLNQWSTLIVYVDDGNIEIDNNRIERAIRPFVIGRNNWMFSDTVQGAESSTRLYSLIETAKLNGLEPYRYLRHVFTELPKAHTVEEIEALLPWAVDKDIINQGWHQS